MKYNVGDTVVLRPQFRAAATLLGLDPETVYSVVGIEPDPETSYPFLILDPRPFQRREADPLYLTPVSGEGEDWYKKMQLWCGLPSYTEASLVHAQMFDAREQIRRATVTREEVMNRFYSEGTPFQRTRIKQLLEKVLDGVDMPEIVTAPQPPS